MMSRVKRGLGKNLANLGLTELLDSVAARNPIEHKESPLKQLPIEQLQRGRYQPRRQMDEGALQELADSIRAQGIIQPIVARRLPSGEYEIIAGERRWRAAQRVGLDTVPVLVKDISDEAAMAMALIENIQRRDLNAIEEAAAFERLLNEFSMTHDQVAKAVGKSRAAVTNLLRLLQLTPEVRSMLERGELEMGHARALLAVSAKEQIALAAQVVHRALSVRQIEQLVRQHLEKKGMDSEAGESVYIDPDVKGLQNRLSDALGAKVHIHHSATGKGKLVIQYNSLDELDGILTHIQ